MKKCLCVIVHQKREEIKIDRPRKKIKTDPTTANQRKRKWEREKRERRAPMTITKKHVILTIFENYIGI